jgi:ATP/maltotriose-dependent transcriptional regulator MalT
LFEKAHSAAGTDDDLKEVLWGLILVSLELEPLNAPSLLDDLQSAFPDDIDVRLRVTVGRSIADEQGPSLAGVWERFEALLPAVQHSQDPLAASCFLAIAAAMAVMHGMYARGRELADQALGICGDLRLHLGVGTCLAHRAAAEIGMRQFARAHRSIRLVTQSPIYREDPFFHFEALRLEARLLASQGALEEALETEANVPTDRTLPRPYGAFLSNLALIHAGLGNADQARRTASRAREFGSNIEMRYCAQLAEAIAEDVDGNPARFKELAVAAIVECDRARYLDGVVFANRVYPPILTATRGDPEAFSAVRRALTVGRDQRLARSAGIDVQPGSAEGALQVLTSREREVLGLLLEGKSNQEIAQRLVISPSTAKVHVRHILEKLGVRSRLQAVLRAQELLSIEDR